VLRAIVIGIVGLVVLLTATVAYAAGMTGNFRSVGSGTDSVPHCQVLSYSIAAADTITSVSPQVKCTVGGSYTVEVTVTSGVNSGTGSAAASLTADTPATVAVAISPSVTIGSSTYSVDVRLTR
jgi:hypothetical protein